MSTTITSAPLATTVRRTTKIQWERDDIDAPTFKAMPAWGRPPVEHQVLEFTLTYTWRPGLNAWDASWRAETVQRLANGNWSDHPKQAGVYRANRAPLNDLAKTLMADHEPQTRVEITEVEL